LEQVIKEPGRDAAKVLPLREHPVPAVHGREDIPVESGGGCPVTRYASDLAAHRTAEAEWDRRIGEALAGFVLRRGWTA
jgi:hypothetical protein